MAPVPLDFAADAREDFLLRLSSEKLASQERRGVLVSKPVRHAELFREDYRSVYVNSPATPFYDDALRFDFFSAACVEIIEQSDADVVHINDWPLAFVFARMVRRRLRQARILTSHNVGYQGNVLAAEARRPAIRGVARDSSLAPLFEDPRPSWQSVNPLRLAMQLAHQVNTVSPAYKREMTQPENQSRYVEGGKGLDGIARILDRRGRLHGILNGFNIRTTLATIHFGP